MPVHADEVRRLAGVAARHSVSLVAVGGGTAEGETPPEGPEGAILVRFDLRRGMPLPLGAGGWIEAEPGVPWLNLEDELRQRGRGLAVCPTSAPRATVGGWLATGGLGAGSFEHGHLRENVLSADVVLPGGELRAVSGHEIGRFVEPGVSLGIVVGARLRTRRADADRPFAAVLPGVGEIVATVEDLQDAAAPLWHLALLSPEMVRVRGLGEGYILFGVYAGHRDGEVGPALERVVGARGGTLLDATRSYRIWGERFYPVTPSGPVPSVRRALVPRPGLGEALLAERGQAVQGTVSRSREVLLLVMDSSAQPQARGRGPQPDAAR